MDDWGNLIYIVAAAIFGIYNAVSKRKKNKDKAKTQTAEFKEEYEQAKPGFSEMLESLMSETEINKQEETLAIKKIEEDKPIDNVDNYKFSDNNVIKIRKKQIIPEYNIEDNQEEEIDWRQAILYSEILNRKYN